MKVILEVDQLTESRVRELAEKGERQLLLQLLTPSLRRAVDELVIAPQQISSPRDTEQVLAEMDDLADETERILGTGHQPLPPEALTREGIYGDHP